jgi:cytochrome b561
MTTDTPARWSGAAKILHWGIAILVIVELIYGARNYTLDMYDPADGGWYARTIAMHKSVGLVAWVLALALLVQRLWRGRPAWPAAMSVAQRALARAAHGALYAALILQPVLGYLQSAAFGTRTTFFNLFLLPNIVPVAWQRPYSRVLWRVTQDAHSLLGLGLGILVVVHIAAALKHHFADRDDVLRGMLPHAGR